MENPKENLIQDTTSPEKVEKGFSVEISTTPELQTLKDRLENLDDLINHDSLVNTIDLENLDSSIKQTKLNFNGELMTVEGVKNLIEENEGIWKEIEIGKFDNIMKLTFLPPNIAKFFINYRYHIKLNKVIILPEESVRFLCLSRSHGISLESLRSLTEKSAEYLKGNAELDLRGLTSITDEAAYQLGQGNGDIMLNGLTSISDKTAEYLSMRRGGYINLSGIINLTDKAAESLGESRLKIALDNLESISDKSAKFLLKVRPRVKNQKVIDQIYGEEK